VLTPSSFGETDTQTGVWQPKAYSGSYGTNGFYLNFSDNSNNTSTTLGKDYSGNGNNWTPNGFSVSSGAGNDSLVDSPTSYGVDTGVGGTVRGNYCTLNPLDKSTAGGSARNGNLDYAATQASWDMIRSTFGISSGKWYWEVSVNSSTFGITGIAKASVVLQNNFFNSGDSLGYNSANGNKYDGNGGVSSYGASWQASGDICGVALDMDAGTMTFYKNGTSQGVAYTGITGTYFPTHSLYDTSTATFNFGQRPFVHAAPSGFKALCTQNLPTPTIGATTATQAGKFFTPLLWTATGTTQSITGVGFQPDFLWIKDRQNANGHRLQNIVGGASKYLASDSTNAETTDANFVASIDSDGWSMGSGNYGAGRSLVAWNWKANGSGSSNTAGSITSTVSANTTSGFSIVTYTGTGAVATIGHGLGVVPSMVIVKSRSTPASTYAARWSTYHISLGNTKVIRLESTEAAATASYWNNTTPTSAVFSVDGDIYGANVSGVTYVAYCFAEVAGYSKFGSYTGNGSANGTFIYMGFRPAYVLIKRTDTGGYDWWTMDATRSPTNAVRARLYANDAQAESSNDDRIDIVSNGIKCRNAELGFNANGGTYIYMAFASNPFKYSLAR
jgi:hypothetical protein